MAFIHSKKRDQNIFLNIIRAGDAVINEFFLDSDDFSNGFAGVEQEGRIWKYIDKRGNDVFNKTWNYAGKFKDSMAIVMIGGKYGVIDTRGNVIIDIQHSYLRNGFFSLGISSDTFINSKGEIIWKKTID